ncbi:MAG: Rieske (2Fe-2S) protein [Bacteroidales bacterium]|jgi:nitrite reductase/ring-hydroxylating ferredoxin subunit|nr:Rieske (2Fe-2S) protein [Bacteroidales bacterium]
MKSLIRTRLFSILLMLPLLLVSCGDEEDESLIPYVYVNFTIYPNTLDYIADGSYVYVTGGYKGIIIYRNTHDEFIAYERACPHDPLVAGARVEVESSGIIASCPVCGSRFILTDGSPIQGPASVSLKQYRTRYDGYSLIVSN